MESPQNQAVNAPSMVGIVYPDNKQALALKSLPHSEARGERLKNALAKIYPSKKAMYLGLGVEERSLSRWLNGKPIATNYAEKIASIIISKESEHLARWVFLGAEKRAMPEKADTTDTTDTITLNGEPVDLFHLELIKAYRGLPIIERLNLAAQVLNLPTLSQADTLTDTSGHLDGHALDEHESAIILKLRVIRPASITLSLISRLITEARAV